jgi:hypothetical protein
MKPRIKGSYPNTGVVSQHASPSRSLRLNAMPASESKVIDGISGLANKKKDDL